MTAREGTPMGRGTARRTAAGRASARTQAAPSRAAAAPSRTRSFPCPDDLWGQVESFASERQLGSPAAAARLLIRTGLSVEQRVRELAAARDWQITQAWSEVEAIEAGNRSVGSWEEIEQAAERARSRVRERAAAERRAAANA